MWPESKEHKHDRIIYTVCLQHILYIFIGYDGKQAEKGWPLICIWENLIRLLSVHAFHIEMSPLQSISAAITVMGTASPWSCSQASKALFSAFKDVPLETWCASAVITLKPAYSESRHCLLGLAPLISVKQKGLNRQRLSKPIRSHRCLVLVRLD